VLQLLGPFFISMAPAAKSVLPIAILLAYLIQLDVDVTGNITAKLCEVRSEFKFFCTLVTMATAVERDKPKKSESVGQTLPQLPWKQKRGDLKNAQIIIHA
jgi:hypothetical protein